MDTVRPMPLQSFLSSVSLTLLLAAPVYAQEVVQALPGTTDADALAADMRRLAANPRDVDALVDAAHLSLGLGDMRAAAALLARAENVDPRNARVKAGQGSILVQSERPGQALRYFAQAERLGLNAGIFAADRALAYDLTGEQERAQRDYRTALRDRPADDETIRRYALSLGISGQRQRALALLDPLVRRSDRGAWRAQAFVLAMTGDVGGASRIAATMMPGGAAGLAAFFERLPTLPPADRAFAVHFGEVRPTPERIADARLIPPVSPLPRESGVALASARPLPVPPLGRRDRDLRTQVAAAQPLPPVSAARAPSASFRTALPATTTVPQRVTPVTRTGTALAPVVTATPVPRPAVSAQTGTVLASSQIAAQLGSIASAAQPLAAATPAAASAGLPVLPAATIASATPPVRDVTVSPIAPPSVLRTIPRPSEQLASVRTEAREPDAVVASVPSTGTAPIQVAAIPPVTLRAPAVATRSPASLRASEDSILAKIVAGLSIPAAELGVEGSERPALAEATRPAPIARAPAPVTVKSDPDRASIERLAAARVAADKLATDKLAAEKRAADRKAVAGKKALAEKKAAAEKKALADQEALEARKLARANPERIWVQVAGGAFEGDLPKEFARVKAKAPAVFGGRGAWTTPLRATNRVLAGPFKTDAEARGFVNDLKKEGVSAFTFTSDVGQPVKKLGSK